MIVEPRPSRSPARWVAGLWMLAGCSTAPRVEDTRWLSVAMDDGATGPANAAAQEPQAPAKLEPYTNLYKTFSLGVGGAAYANFDTTLRVDSDALVGAVVDLEDTLGVDDTAAVLRVDANYNFDHYHGIAVGYYDIRRSGRRTLAEDITFGDRTFAAGSSVDHEFNTNVPQS